MFWHYTIVCGNYQGWTAKMANVVWPLRTRGQPKPPADQAANCPYDSSGSGPVSRERPINTSPRSIDSFHKSQIHWFISFMSMNCSGAIIVFRHWNISFTDTRMNTAVLPLPPPTLFNQSTQEILHNSFHFIMVCSQAKEMWSYLLEPLTHAIIRIFTVMHCLPPQKFHLCHIPLSKTFTQTFIL